MTSWFWECVHKEIKIDLGIVNYSQFNKQDKDFKHEQELKNKHRTQI